MYLVYSCVFFQWSYINLLNLLLKSYALTEDKKDITYLVICHPQLKEHIENLFLSLNIEGKIWCMDLTTLFEAGYSRLFIFDYPEVNTYKKILYLDTDIIINKSLTNILNREIEDKLYAMREGNTNSVYHGSNFFEGNNPNVTTFTSAILFFNNCETIKNLFNETLNHIKQYIAGGHPIPGCLDQPFIVYNAVIRKLYDNEMLDEYTDGIIDSYNNKVLSHFPCGPGNYNDKFERMSNFLKIIMSKRVDENKKITIFEYVKLYEKNKHHFDKLKEICDNIGERVEGNCFTEHLNFSNEIQELIFKQLNHCVLGKINNNIMEIGFNAGHSSLLYLISNPNSQLTIFDICEHKYTIPCFEYLQSIFPDRLRIYPGDSTITVPKFFTDNPKTKFDLIHIDGYHLDDVPNKDFHNSIKMASDYIIWDDTQIPHLNHLFNQYISSGIIQETHIYETLVYKHRIGRVDYLCDKKYTWQNSIIEFLPNGRMNAFGQGVYKYINTGLIKADFGGHKHFLRFSEDRKTFVSIRKDDFDNVNGSLIN